MQNRYKMGYTLWGIIIVTYLRKEKAFNLTETKMRYWHRHAMHINKPDCLFCRGDMYEIAQYLQENGLEVLEVGDAWIKIRAEKNYRVWHGGVTDEVDLLYKIVTGKKDVENKTKLLRQKLTEKNIDMTCPNCYSKLKVKYGIFGFFLGCSNYPRCRYTKKIEYQLIDETPS